MTMTEQGTHTIDLVRNAFREYYFRTKQVVEPANIAQREFGYSLFREKGMNRHISFGNMGELIATLVREAPADVYCSNAWYRFPTRAMQEKEWLGADLIFDIDGKDLDLPCVASHSYVTCTSCNYADRLQESKLPFACPSCKGTKSDQVSIPCAKCVEATKSELKGLIRFLTEDFGIDSRSIMTYFSGNNGFHVHVYDAQFGSLDAHARSDLAGYVAGAGLIPESIGVRKGAPGSVCVVKFPRGGIGYGWRKRIADKLKVEGSSTVRLYNTVANLGGYQSFRSELDRMARDIGIRIDAQVTSDVHRIFRMPGTLNGKSGLAKSRCLDIDSFVPSADACVLGDAMVSVKLKCPVKFRLRNKTYNLSKEKSELPTYAAVYLVCKQIAEAA